MGIAYMHLFEDIGLATLAFKILTEQQENVL